MVDEKGRTNRDIDIGGVGAIVGLGTGGGNVFTLKFNGFVFTGSDCVGKGVNFAKSLEVALAKELILVASEVGTDFKFLRASFCLSMMDR